MKKILSVFLATCMLLTVSLAIAIPTAADSAVTNTFDANSDTPQISTVDDYIAFFNSVFVEKNDYEGKVVTMVQDITFNDTSAADWYTQSSAVKLLGTSGGWGHFKGTFDGGNHTLKGVIVEGVFRDADNPIGLFPYAAFGAAIKNLTVDGFYMCSSNTTAEPSYGNAGIGGLIGHAKGNITVDNVTLKNGTFTCTADAKGGIGAIAGTYDGQVAEQQFKITNTTVEESVKVIGNDTVYVGGIIGYVHENYLSHPTTIDVSASRIQPSGSMDSDITLKPIGSFKSGGNPTPKFSWTLKNTSTDYSKTIEMNGGEDYTNEWNKEFVASGCYGSAYVDLSSYTVTWSVDGKVTTEEYPQGAVPSYKGSTDKPMTDTHLYVFTGWSPAIAPVTTDVTYTAQYEEHEKVAVTWIVDGQTTVEYYIKGETPNYKGETNKEQDDDFVYIFKGWDKQIVAADEDATYTAVYENKAKYEITWVIDGVETKETYLAGIKPSFKGKVEKAEDEEYTYKFIGWDKEIVPADGDVVYTAQFEKTPKNPAAASDDATSDGGCGSTISIGLVSLVLVGAVGVFAVRKKED